MGDTELASLEALAKAATPGKWYEGNKSVFVDEPANPFSNALQNVLRDVPEARANVAYIAAANPAAILSLIEENKRMREATNGLTGLLQLIAGRPDVSDELRTVLATNHRVEEARVALETK